MPRQATVAGIPSSHCKQAGNCARKYDFGALAQSLRIRDNISSQQNSIHWQPSVHVIISNTTVAIGVAAIYVAKQLYRA